MSASVGAKKMAGEVATFSTLGILILTENPKIQHTEPSPSGVFRGKIQQKARLALYPYHPVRHFIFQHPTVTYQAMFLYFPDIALGDCPDN